MSGFLGVLAALVGGVVSNPLAAMGELNTLPTGNSGTATITLNTDGSITKSVAGTGSGATPTGPTQWSTFIAAGVGTGVWVRATPTVGTFTSNAMSAFTQLTSNLAVVNGPTAVDKNTTFTLDFSYDAGATIAVTSTGNTLQVQHI